MFLSEQRKGGGIFPRKWFFLMFSTKHAHGKSVQEWSTEGTSRLSMWLSVGSQPWKIRRRVLDCVLHFPVCIFSYELKKSHSGSEDGWTETSSHVKNCQEATLARLAKGNSFSMKNTGSFGGGAPKEKVQFWKLLQYVPKGSWFHLRPSV